MVAAADLRFRGETRGDLIGIVARGECLEEKEATQHFHVQFESGGGVKTTDGTKGARGLRDDARALLAVKEDAIGGIVELGEQFASEGAGVSVDVVGRSGEWRRRKICRIQFKSGVRRERHCGSASQLGR